MTTILLISVLGAVISAIVGTCWYGGATPMGKWHMQYLGFDKLTAKQQAAMIAEAKPHMWKTYSAQMLLSFMTAFFIASVTGFTVQNGGPASAVYMYVLMIWAAFTIPSIGQSLLWGNCKGRLAWKIFLSNSFSNLVTFLIVAYVATLFY